MPGYTAFARLSVIVSLLLGAAGCASGPRPRAPGKVPVTVALPDRSGVMEPQALDSSTRSITLRISGAMPQDGPIRKPLAIRPDLVPPGKARLEAKLSGLPVELAIREVGGGVWELEIPTNVLKLLGKDDKAITYSGRLQLDGAGDNLPLRLTITPGGTRSRAGRHGPRRQSAG